MYLSTWARAAQARALVNLLGPLQPGELPICDLEEGSGWQGGRWNDWATVIHGAYGIAPWLYSGQYFAQTTGLAPHWVADYGATPSIAHLLWQFTDSYNVPGVGTCDCSVFQGSIAQLAQYAYKPPPPRPTVAQWVCEGMLSLHDLCATQLHCDVAMVLWMTAENSPHSMFTAGMATYLNQVFAADKVKVPGGITVWHPDVSTVTPFHSHGDQTLQGLANTWGCQPSALVRLTAENSPGAVFAADMSQYLNSVFQRSTVHAPAGTVLFYLQG